jgi:hypothetical protein
MLRVPSAARVTCSSANTAGIEPDEFDTDPLAKSDAQSPPDPEANVYAGSDTWSRADNESLAKPAEAGGSPWVRDPLPRREVRCGS